MNEVYLDILKEEFNNPYGIKEFKYDDEGVLTEEYTKFNSWEEGVEAHLDHLALYFGAEGYPKEDSKDSRHFYYLYGIYEHHIYERLFLLCSHNKRYHQDEYAYQSQDTSSPSSWHDKQM